MIEFTKMEGTGNDYVYFQGEEEILELFSSEWIRRIADRHFGVGGDGVVFLLPSRTAAGRMKMFNADGSPSAMCGNALRSVAYLIWKNSGKMDFVIESDVGLHQARILETDGKGGALVSVEIGAPVFALDRIPYDPSGGLESFREGNLIGFSLPSGESLEAYLVSMGNPHCVVFVDDPDAIDLPVAGAWLENHPSFPSRTNVEFITTGEGWIRQRTWERGSGETLSCGSGACASLVAARETGRTGPEAVVHLRGGDLEIHINDAGDVTMIGPVREVFQGKLSLEQMEKEID